MSEGSHFSGHPPSRTRTIVTHRTSFLPTVYRPIIKLMNGLFHLIHSIQVMFHSHGTVPFLLVCSAILLRVTQSYSFSSKCSSCSSRREILASTIPILKMSTIVLTLNTIVPETSNAAQPNGIELNTSKSGLQWADVKVGSGVPSTKGSTVSIDFSMASTAGRFPQIYTTKDKGAPYRWTLGDGSTIIGIEKAIMGDTNSNDGDIPPMLPGGIRRVIIPSTLGYEGSNHGEKCGPVGPIPPKDQDGGGPYQRWVQFYCNPRIPYQPDLVLDIKLYGSRR